MRTPKEYTDNLKQSIITVGMLSDCIYSVNKRAKNCREKERQYRHYNYETECKYREQKNEYYGMKDKLLSILKPTCIHYEEIMERERIYDYEPCYYEMLARGEFIHEGGYYDREMREYVSFGDIMVTNKAYYLFYDLFNHTFHTPIHEETLKHYEGLEVKKIDALITTGKEITDLISVQFVQKVLGLIGTNNFKLVF